MLNQQGNTTNTNSPTDLGMEKINWNLDPATNVKPPVKLKHRAPLWGQQHIPSVVFPLHLSCLSRAPLSRSASSLLRPPNRNSLGHYKHLACLSLGEANVVQACPVWAKGVCLCNAQSPAATQDIVLYPLALTYVIVWSVREPEGSLRRTTTTVSHSARELKTSSDGTK